MTSLPKPPRAHKVPKTITEHGETREDPYFWFREKENPDVAAYVREENAYYASVMGRLSDLKQGYFEKLKGRMAPEAVEVPYRKGPHLYSSRIPEGAEYRIYYRDEKPILDLNEIAKAHDYVSLGAFETSDTHDLLAYALDTEGDEIHRIHFKALDPGKTAPTETIENTEGEVVFSEDGKFLYYLRLNDQHRPFQVWRHTLGTDPATDLLLYEEHDPRFFVSLGSSSDGAWVFVEVGSAESSEVRFARRDQPITELELFRARGDKHEYSLDAQGDRFLIHSNHAELNFGLYETPSRNPERDPKAWNPILVGDARIDVRDFVPFENHFAVLYAKDGIPSVRIYPEGTDLEFSESIREIAFLNNEEYTNSFVRLSYASPITPTQTLDFDLKTRAKSIRHELVVPGFRREDYVVERIQVPSSDGVPIPVSLMYRKVDQGKALPTLLYGYGSYGMVTTTAFSIMRSVIVDAGFLYAIAHVRGSGDLGQRWYHEGKYLKKKNTFLDFQAAAKGLVSAGRTIPGEITIHGGSAGGLLVGATLNLDPSLFRGVIAEVPFVDVLSTMFDESLPLTPIEWNEWGDPRNPEFFHAMKDYSPYDRLVRGEYPYILVNGGWNDPRVTYWEPTKYVAKLRDLRTDDRLTILDIEMGAGHFGVTGRFAALEKPSELLAFLHAIHFERERLR
jgi:oligopeptidase B